MDREEFEKRSMIEQAKRLITLIHHEAPKVILANEIGLLLVRMMKKYGREEFDRAIAQHQRVFDARVNGICDECLVNPAIGGETFDAPRCISCNKMFEDQGKEMEIDEAMELEPLNSKSKPS